MPIEFKRREESIPVPKSVTSLLLGLLRTDFVDLKIQLEQDDEYVDKEDNPEDYLECLVEDLSRYLYLIALQNDEVNGSISPSLRIAQAHQSLIRHVVFYAEVCKAILTYVDKSVEIYPNNVLPFIPYNAEENTTTYKVYQTTRQLYQEVFKEVPSFDLWPVNDHLEYECENEESF